MTTTAPQIPENPIKTLVQSSDPTPTPVSEPPPHDSSTNVGGAKDQADKTAAAAATAVDSCCGKDSDIQKKMKRAERFGMTVQLSEQEKRNTRAERFGTASAAQGSDALKKAEEQKRKARAERFGLKQSDSADEEAKKKARVARFAPPAKADPVEEDKRKARALRFSQSQSGSQSQENGKEKIEQETAVVEKAGGGT
ncbi:protein MODIFIER OF SNC1 11-like [Lycium ferocissimum]|uniref:protein MODIFIER OF SNC1 11-like n=1 Tax=Lycium ferocissimum TaxID=112874 RepID=UPI00281625DB|nr:protein MODIFIER OF SNC1 11-like [Lycium ferocissimum]